MTARAILHPFSRSLSTRGPEHTVHEPGRRDVLPAAGAAEGPVPDTHVIVVHRVGAFTVAAAIGVFGVVGLAGGLAFFDTHGRSVLGLSSNGLLAVVSLVTAAVLVAAAVRSGWLASTVMMVVGSLFLVSALVNLAVLDTAFNLLAFRLPNVFFSIAAGLVLLLLGAYGRVSGHLPDNNPYRKPTLPSADAREPWRPSSREEIAADIALAAAYRDLAAGTADAATRRDLRELDGMRRHEDRRRRWIDLHRVS